ncbi:MAG TPA: type II toxin-antitoxin system VapC family toxin [Bacteroidia bacterium]|jgi:hypothetical protein|nr:type II toxin-antitoxin system VapC family toxin [Bacteroidia bacterium]
MLNKCQVHISFITELELLGYKSISSSERVVLKSFISACSIVDINNEIKEKSVRIRQKHRLKLPDSIIAASALYLDIPFISADKDFSKVKELNLVLYEK